MKIGINTLFLIPGEVGGTETYLRQTLLAMAENSPAVSLVLFTNRENDPVLRNDLGRFKQVEFVLLDFMASNRYARIVREQIELPGKVKSAGVDVLWSPGYTAPLSCSCPQVVTIPDMQYKTFPRDLTLLARLVTDFLVKMAVRRSRRIIAISNFSRDEINRYTGADKNKIDVTHLAANQAAGEIIPENKRKAILSELVPGDRPYILSVANTYPHKNIHSLVKAFAGIMGKVPHNLVLVGNARLGEEEVQAALCSIPDKKRVIRLQKLPVQQITALYQGCDVFVFPSLYEGFGLPVLEAMKAGVPAIAARCGSVVEVGGKEIEYFDPCQTGGLETKIIQILGWSAEERGRRTAAARERAATFSWKRTAGQTVESIERALGKP